MRGARILIVDDSEVGRNLLLGQLSYFGYSAIAVNSGLDAIAAAATGQFNMILMDIFMPGLDGIETTQKIRQAEAKTGLHVPIIAVSGGADKQSCLVAGLDDFLTKPILLEDLKRIIGRWLPISATPVEERGISQSI